jgi:hypothetical protein
LAAIGWNSMKFDICVFFENRSRKFRFHYNLTKIMGPLLARPVYIYDHISLISSWNEKYFRKKL